MLALAKIYKEEYPNIGAKKPNQQKILEILKLINWKAQKPWWRLESGKNIGNLHLAEKK